MQYPWLCSFQTYHRFKNKQETEIQVAQGDELFLMISHKLERCSKKSWRTAQTCTNFGQDVAHYKDVVAEVSVEEMMLIMNSNSYVDFDATM